MLKLLISILLLAIIHTKDYYKILNVTRTVDKSTLKKAYKKKLHKLHPDRYQDEKEKL